MNAAISVLRGYREMLDSYNVQHVRAVATSAVREATNSDAFIDRIFMAVGLDVEIIEASEELRLTVSAVRETLTSKKPFKGHTLVADVGGGSALMAVLQDDEIINSGSYALGSIRLQEALDITGEPPRRVADMLRQQIGSVVSAMGATLPLEKIQTLVAVGGDVRFAAAQVGREGPNEHIHVLSPGQFDAFVEEVCNHSPDDLTRQYKIPFADAETLVPALLVYQAVLEATDAGELLVCDVSMRDGLMHDLAMQALGRKDTQEASSAIRSAMSIAEKYHCDLAHAEHVATLSLMLFDQFQDVHHLQPRHRLLLQVAALLHEVGGYVNGRAHHKHSYYLISNSEVFGLRAHEQQMVANIARYHRRSAPKPSHQPYMSLPREDRVVVCKLAAILRIADALERGHNQQVRKIHINHDEDEMVLHVDGVKDLALEERALENKADLFEEVFGLKIRLETFA
jgi:exopolyphosphatase/guanosine-5'-triphosphate,3'-diphosphate pyrophosphatase